LSILTNHEEGVFVKKAIRLVPACFAVLAASTLPVANAAVVWGNASGFGWGGGSVYFSAYATHDSLTDDDYYNSYGVYADAGYPGGGWEPLANSFQSVTDSNIYDQIGNGDTAAITDGTYWIGARLYANNNQIDGYDDELTCYEYYQACSRYS
jgi:hypothetical protein